MRTVKKEAGQIEEEEQSPLISGMPNLEVEKSPSKSDEQLTWEDQEISKSKGIYEMNM